jgi:hypothetical protein
MTRRPGRAALVAAAGFLLVAANPVRAETASVTVVDHLSEGQQEETIAVYFAGVLAGTLHIDAGHPDDQFTATIPRVPNLTYTLCGRLLRREMDGSVSTHPIDNGGVLGDVAGRTLFANTIGDKLFSLEGSEGAATGQVQAGPACVAATS